MVETPVELSAILSHRGLAGHERELLISVQRCLCDMRGVADILNERGALWRQLSGL